MQASKIFPQKSHIGFSSLVSFRKSSARSNRMININHYINSYTLYKNQIKLNQYIMIYNII
jgi:hypothetical protein